MFPITRQGLTKLIFSRHCSSLSKTSPALIPKVKLQFFRETPVTLFYLASAVKVRLREYHAQLVRGNFAFDFVVGKDGLIHPVTTEYYEVPNGLSLRAHGFLLWDNLASNKVYPKIYVIPAGTSIPEDLVLVREGEDHYSLQTTKPRPVATLNLSLNAFISQFPPILKDEYFAKYPLHNLRFYDSNSGSN